MALRERAGRDWGTNLSRVKDYNEVVVFHVVRNTPTTRKLSLVDEPSETRGRRRAA
jgi:hypothetical protein